ncbi:MAG: hypothetical protein HOP12_03885 [Candidatus Eisenbacteria bacterium]|uniref:Glycogen debranching enzyme C-terminal domain-containing protein n=1 Tax=Eiseniibacteriota bacterium TaxID=2212470 RepID=A0A849SD50_UNCEI|nr:hypothetical protein [Candidatus Eisenbacteria bacterium]
MRLGQDVLTDLDQALAQEWLLADGVGGCALGTAAGARARPEHALLIASDHAGHAAVALLALDARVTHDGETLDLATHRLVGDASAPAGYRHLESFTADPWPRATFRSGAIAVQQAYFMLSGHSAVVASWLNTGSRPIRISVAPLLVARGPSIVHREDPALIGVVKGQPGRVTLQSREGFPTLTLWHSGTFLPARVWQRGHVLETDESFEDAFAAAPDATSRATRAGAGARGANGARSARRIGTVTRAAVRVPNPSQAGHDPAAGEDALAAGYIEATLAPGQWLHVVAAVEPDLFKTLAHESRLGTPPPSTLAGCVERLERHEREHLSLTRNAAVAGADFTARQAAAAQGGDGMAQSRRSEPLVDHEDPWITRFATALELALVSRGSRLTLVTLPDGEEHGVTALRALPGLLSLRAFEPVAAVLRGYAEYVDEGYVPESFDAAGSPRYGDPRASLWLIHAAERYARRSGEIDLVRDTLYPALESIMQYFRAGTRGGLRVDSEGLLSLDAGDGPTRFADLNALWYHALVAMAQLARLVGRRENGAFYLAWAREHQQRFVERFWDASRGQLAYAITNERALWELHPELVLAASLPPTLLAPEQARTLVETIERELMTPLGLREAPGSRRVRPEWVGSFASAWLRAHGRSAEAQTRVRGWLDALGEHTGLSGHLPELFVLPRSTPVHREGGASNAAPMRPRRAGAAAAPVAVAECVRVRIEELDRAESAVAVG